jgi:hypothetical protein
MEHGKPVSVPLGKSLRPMVMQVEEVGKSEGCIVMMISKEINASPDSAQWQWILTHSRSKL